MTGIAFGNLNIPKISMGNTDIKKVSMGDTLVWPAEIVHPPHPNIQEGTYNATSISDGTTANTFVTFQNDGTFYITALDEDFPSNWYLPTTTDAGSPFDYRDHNITTGTNSGWQKFGFYYSIELSTAAGTREAETHVMDFALAGTGTVVATIVCNLVADGTTQAGVVYTPPAEGALAQSVQRIIFGQSLNQIQTASVQNNGPNQNIGSIDTSKFAYRINLVDGALQDNASDAMNTWFTTGQHEWAANNVGARTAELKVDVRRISDSVVVSTWYILMRPDSSGGSLISYTTIP